jgi:hypothetical protein
MELWTWQEERKRKIEEKKKKKGKVQIHNYGVASERYCMVRYSDGASPRR